VYHSATFVPNSLFTLVLKEQFGHNNKIKWLNVEKPFYNSIEFEIFLPWVGESCVCLHELFYAEEEYYVLKKTITQPSHG
jgi:hypothetical protein